MAESSASTALTKRNAETALMPPPPLPKKIKRPSTVLDEDVYTDALSHIIARDFFPGLLETQAQQEYLQALESNDNSWIKDAGRRLTAVMTPGPDGRKGRRGTSIARTVAGTQTPGRTPGSTPRGPWEGETPVRLSSMTPGSSHEDEGPKRPAVDLDLSLSAFQAKYTSEDNESFNTVLDKQNLKRAEKYAFLQHGNKVLAPRQIAHRAREQKLLASRSQAEHNGALILRPSADPDARPASYDGFKSRQGPRNTFMFAPDGVEDTHQTLAQTAQETSLAPPKSTKFTATRMALASDEASPSVAPSPSLSAIDAAIAGRPRPSSSTDDGYDGAATPRVNGYAFVDAEPTPSEIGVPIDDEEVERIEREAAMALMPKVDEDDGKAKFRLQDRSKREEVHMRLVEGDDVGRRKAVAGGRVDALRKGLGVGGRTPTPSFVSSPALGARGVDGKPKGNLTPAGQALAARIGRTPGREGSLFDSGHGRRQEAGKKAWTPTPVMRKKT